MLASSSLYVPSHHNMANILSPGVSMPTTTGPIYGNFLTYILPRSSAPSCCKNDCLLLLQAVYFACDVCRYRRNITRQCPYYDAERGWQHVDQRCYLR